MKKQIVVSRETRERLRKAFGVTRVMVWKALNYESDTELARKIRHTALKEMDGEVVGGITDWDTTFQEVEKKMTQTFGDRVKIIVYRDTNRTAVLVDGKVKQEKDGLSVTEFMKLQQEVLRIANELPSR